MILLDTNVVSEAQRPHGHPRVKEAVERRRDDVHLSTIVLGEILYGVALLDPGARRVRLKDFYTGLRSSFSDRVQPVVTPVAEIWADLRAAHRRAGKGMSLAATALHHGLTLWTRNTRDFEGTGARLFNPWED